MRRSRRGLPDERDALDPVELGTNNRGQGGQPGSNPTTDGIRKPGEFPPTRRPDASIDRRANRYRLNSRPDDAVERRRGRRSDLRNVNLLDLIDSRAPCGRGHN